MRSLRALPSGGDDPAELLRREPLALTRAELISLTSDRKLRTAVERGEVVRILPNTYVAAEHQHSFQARADAALTWAGPGAALAGRSALYAWSLVDEPGPTITITVPQADHRECADWLRTLRVAYVVDPLPAAGLTCARVAVAIAQAFGDLSRDEQSDVVFGAVARRLTNVRQLRQALVDVPRIRFRRRLTSRIEAAERGAESWLEEHSLRKVFAGKAFDQFIRQHEVFFEGDLFRLDMFDPFTRTAVELDGARWHRTDEQRVRDIRRDAILAAMGIQTIRLASRDLTERADWCRGVVHRAVAARAAAHAERGERQRPTTGKRAPRQTDSQPPTPR
ncbi:hypothetical protein [Demequina sp. NBRC 110056]|uniref:hypothetical protein n=1 Tax=Demequina sp. NBRC 110056 TaxID=1570345 RepID=UPI000A049F74|nr:hypothetical protein [Demequina sp. NBRC 110056]